MDTMVKAAISMITIALFLWAASSGTIGTQVLGVVLLALVLWSLFPKYYLVSSIIVIGLLAFFEASLNIEEFIESLFATYGSSSLWIIVAGFILSAGIEASGLANRLALGIVTGLGSDPQKVVLSVAVANLAIAPISPSTTAKAFMLLPICNSLIAAFGVEKGRSLYGASVMMMAMVGNNICSTGFLTATIPNAISAEYIRNSTGVQLSWFDWLRMALPLTVILLAASWVVCRLMFRPEVEKTPQAVERIAALRGALGPINGGEKLVAVLFIASLFLWISERYLQINGGIISLALSFVLLFPRAGVMKIRGFVGKTPWGSIALFAASIFLARAVGRWEALNPVAEGVFRLVDLSALSPFVFIALIVFVFMMLHVVFTSTTVFATLMMPIVISLSGLSGHDPRLVAIPVAFLAPIALILPVNTIPNIVFHSSGFFNQRQMTTYGILMSLISATVIIALGIPYWVLGGFI